MRDISSYVPLAVLFFYIPYRKLPPPTNLRIGFSAPTTPQVGNVNVASNFPVPGKKPPKKPHEYIPKKHTTFYISCFKFTNTFPALNYSTYCIILKPYIVSYFCNIHFPEPHILPSIFLLLSVHVKIFSAALRAGLKIPYRKILKQLRRLEM